MAHPHPLTAKAQRLPPSDLLVLLLLFHLPAPISADCSLDLVKRGTESITVSYDVTTCPRVQDKVKLCLKPKNLLVHMGRCRHGVVETLWSKEGTYTFTGLWIDEDFKIKGVYAHKRFGIRNWKKFAVLETSTLRPLYSFRTLSGYYLVSEKGGRRRIKANRTVAGPWEQYTIKSSWRSPASFQSGQEVCLEDHKRRFVTWGGLVESDGRGILEERGRPCGFGIDSGDQADTVRIWRVNDDLSLETEPTTIEHCDNVAFEVSNSRFFTAENGGGGGAFAEQGPVRTFQVFTIEFEGRAKCPEKDPDPGLVLGGRADRNNGIFVVGGAGELRHFEWDQGWKRRVVDTWGNIAVAGSLISGPMRVFGVLQNGQVFNTYAANSDTRFGILGDSPGDVEPRSLALGGVVDEHNGLFGVNSDGELVRAHWDGTAWKWDVMDSSGVAVVPGSLISGSMRVFGVLQDGRVFNTYGSGPATKFAILHDSPSDIEPKSLALGGTPASNNGLFAVNSDGELVRAHWDGTWEWDVIDTWGTAVVPGSLISGSMRVFGVLRDGRVFNTYGTGTDTKIGIL